MPPRTMHDQYLYWSDDWQMIRDFCAGERVVKSRGERYLPRFPDMEVPMYLAYKDNASFLNATERTVAGLVGVVFRRPPRIELGESNKKLEGGLKYITQDGASIETLARNLVTEVVRMGRYGMLVDMPVDGGAPYVAEYRAEKILNWRQSVVKGRRMISRVLLEECADDPDSDVFIDEDNCQYRELWLTSDGYKHLVDKDDGEPVEVSPVRRGIPLTEIPFVFVGPLGLTPDVQRSPMLDICNLNVKHYRKSAELSHGQRHAAIPTYVVSGFTGNEDAEFVVGPNRVWMIPDGGDAKILEFTGAGLTYLENAVDKAQADMAIMGARLIGSQRKAASESSDIVQMRERGEHATLWTIVDSCERALTKILQYWVWWQGGEPAEVSVTLNKDFVDMPMAYRDTLQLARLYQSEILPLDVIIEALYEGDIIPSRWKPEDVKRLRDEPGQLYVDPKLAANTPPTPKTPNAPN